MSDRVTILTAGDDEVFIDLLEHFPPERYELLFGDGLAQVRPLYDTHDPRLLVVRLGGMGWQLTPILREARCKQLSVLGLSDVRDKSWVPGPQDRLLPPRPTAPVVEAARELVGERRQFARTPLSMPLDLGGGEEAVATVSSAGSLFVPHSAPLAAGEQLELGIAYEGTELRCTTSVLRLEEGPGGPGMVLGIPEGRARILVDAIVRRMLLSEHYRRLAEQNLLDEAVGRKIAARARRILLEAVAGAADDAEQPARLVVTQRTQPPRTFHLPPEFSIPANELEAAWAEGIELATDLQAAATGAASVAAAAPAAAPAPVATREPEPAPQPAVATREPAPQRAVAPTPAPEPAFDPPYMELGPTEAGVFPARKPMRTPSPMSALNGASPELLAFLEARLAGVEGRVRQLVESRPPRDELQQQLESQAQVAATLAELRTRVEEGLGEIVTRVAEQLAQQASAQGEALERLTARMEQIGRAAADELGSLRERTARQQAAQDELAARLDGGAARAGDASVAAPDGELAQLRAASDVQQQELASQGARLEAAVARCEELSEELTRQEHQAHQATTQLSRRVEVHAALVESFEGRIEEQTQYATRTTVEAQRAREERAQLRRQIDSLAGTIALLKDQFVEQRGALLVFQSDLQRMQAEVLLLPGATAPESGELGTRNLPRTNEPSGLVTQLELRAALEKAQTEWSSRPPSGVHGAVDPPTEK